LLAIVNDAPVIFPSHRIKVAFPQEALIVRVHQHVDVVGITAEFGVVETNSPGVLQPPVNGFCLLVAAYRLRYFGGRNRECEKHQQDHE
jgi:hypothetical protein